MAKQPSSNPTYKLTYFNIKALGEPIRMLFHYGGIKFEDNRIEREDWPNIKSTMPAGQMPVLDIDGIRTHQSLAICRYLGKKVGLSGSNDWENLLIDMTVDTVNDFRIKVGDAHWEEDEAIKQKRSAELKADIIPFYLDKIEAMAKENNGYLALGRLTWADVHFLGVYDYINFMLGYDMAENRPNLKRVVTNVSNISSIQEWLQKRPKSDH